MIAFHFVRALIYCSFLQRTVVYHSSQSEWLGKVFNSIVWLYIKRLSSGNFYVSIKVAKVFESTVWL
jgi:hypothetical protein